MVGRSRERDSNSRPELYKSPALPTELSRQDQYSRAFDLLQLRSAQRSGCTRRMGACRRSYPFHFRACSLGSSARSCGRGHDGAKTGSRYELVEGNSDAWMRFSRHADCMRIRWPLSVLGLLLTGCIGMPPSASTAPSTSVTRSETPPSAFSAASPTTVATAPLPTGARVPAAGTIYLMLGSELIRYDGATGTVTDAGQGAEFSHVSAAGAYVTPNGGSASLIAWDGTTTTLDCGVLRRRVSIDTRGDCAGVRGDLSLTVQRPPEPPRVVIPPGGGALDVAWRPDGTALAVIKRSGQFENSLWVMAPDGSERELYKAPPGGTGDTLYWPTWSPDGSVIAVVLNRFG